MILLLKRKQAKREQRNLLHPRLVFPDADREGLFRVRAGVAIVALVRDCVSIVGQHITEPEGVRIAAVEGNGLLKQGLSYINFALLSAHKGEIEECPVLAP